MAHFRGSLRGARGEVTRLGTKNSGLWQETNGWHVGVTVCANVDDDGNDYFTIYRTGGSHQDIPASHIGTVTKGKFQANGKSPREDQWIETAKKVIETQKTEIKRLEKLVRELTED